MTAEPSLCPCRLFQVAQAAALVLLWFPVLAGCADPQILLLHRQAAFGGTVQITTPDGRVLLGELTFDRRTGNRQWVRRGAKTIALSRRGDGGLSLFEDGHPQPTPGPSGEAEFAIVDRVLDADPDGVSLQAGGYRLADGHQVRVLSVQRFHGG